MSALMHAQLTEGIIGAAIEVHRYWGPGLYEEIYERSLVEELGRRELTVQAQTRLPLVYKDVKVGDDLRLDIWVDRTVIVEVKAVMELQPIHEAQLLTYMRLTRSPVGLLINFNAIALKDGGIKRRVL